MIFSPSGYKDAGQATVEAAFLIPVVFCVLLMLIQPGMILYDRVVMNAAASDACRLLATKTDASGDMSGAVDAFVRHRLGAIPPVDCFHVHASGCSWDIQVEGNECSDQVRVVITNKVKPLPLFDVAASLLSLTDDGGTLSVKVEASRQTQPGWVASTDAGRNPQGWIGAWS